MLMRWEWLYRVFIVALGIAPVALLCLALISK